MVGDYLKWSWVKKIAVATVFTIAAILLTYPSEAGEPVDTSLKAATARIENGTGFLLKTEKGTWLVTNFHVCLHGSWQGVLTASLESGRVVRGHIVKKGMLPDLCAARIEDRDLQALKIAPRLLPLEAIYTRGYPYGVLSQSGGHYRGAVKWRYTFTVDQIGECPKEGTKEYDPYGLYAGCSADFTDNLTTLYARPGSSGSPVVNSKGELVGVMSSWFGDQDSGGMVRLEDIQQFFKGL